MCLINLEGENPDQTTGIQIVQKALEEPLRQIVNNAGIEGSVVLQKVREGKDDYGFNAATEVYENLVKSGVIDPTKVARTALENAASVLHCLLQPKQLYLRRKRKNNQCLQCRAAEWVIWAECINRRVLIDGIDISEKPIEAKRLIGYIPDQPFLYEKFTGREFLYFCGGLYKIDKNTLKKKIDYTIEQLKIDQWVDKRTEEYSQGMKQRIAIASGLLHDPKLLVVDEPMVGLDPQSALVVKNVLKQKAADGIAIFMSTHSLNVAEEICSRIGIIKDGAMIFEDKKEVVEKIRGTDHQNLESLFLELTK
jgi:ABC-2 type transport system ATP-binding protein